MSISVESYIQRLKAFVEAEDYAGYDPYDALNSPLLRVVSSRSKSMRMAVTQLMRRSPINLRPLLGVRKGHNPKAVGLFLWGYSRLYRMHRGAADLDRIHYLLDLIETLRSEGYSGNSWGYNFDWQSRTFFRPKGTPTVVNTAFIGHALLDCYEHTGIQQALDLAIPIKDFILRDLNRIQQGDAFCFSYTPIDTDAVHNANLLGASILGRIAGHLGDGQCREAALSSLAYSMKCQRDDGSWFYAEPKMQNWIDSFHTGFNLQALRSMIDTGLAREYTEGYERGVKYYADHFFLADGTPKYYHDRVYPIDIHAPAEAVYFFSGMGNAYEELTSRVLKWMLKNMASPAGCFYFRKGKFMTNGIPYMRWSQAWVFHALTEYLLQSTKGLEPVVADGS